MIDSNGRVAAVLIGRNEGARLLRCLASVVPHVERTVYVDSGSTDGSVAAAQAAGAEVVLLDTDRPFTAARARNAGLDRLRQDAILPEFVQFVDGDCELSPGWIETACGFLNARPDVGVTCGRLRERFPEASIWNRLADREWEADPGEARACGGIALFRMTALDAVGGFDPRLIAGEEPELCVRLRRAGWRIWRLEAEMTLHDAAMTRFRQWWRRARRGGHAYAEGYALHGRPPERHKASELARALLWGGALPVASLAGAVLLGPWALLMLLAYPLQVLRLRSRGEDWARAVFLTLAKFPEAQGVVDYVFARMSGRRRGLIEYK
jgi:GT2 family glycosyltransferase